MKKFMWVAMMAMMMCNVMVAKDAKPNSGMKANAGMKARRMAEKLMLDDAATAKFIPLYQEYMEALSACRAPREKVDTARKQMTDAELDAQMKLRFESQQKRLDVQKTYYEKFKKIMTVRQVQKLYAPEKRNGVGQGNRKMKDQGPMNKKDHKGHPAKERKNS